MECACKCFSSVNPFYPPLNQNKKHPVPFNTDSNGFSYVLTRPGIHLCLWCILGGDEPRKLVDELKTAEALLFRNKRQTLFHNPRHTSNLCPGISQETGLIHSHCRGQKTGRADKRQLLAVSLPLAETIPWCHWSAALLRHASPDSPYKVARAVQDPSSFY